LGGLCGGVGGGGGFFCFPAGGGVSVSPKLGAVGKTKKHCLGKKTRWTGPPPLGYKCPTFPQNGGSPGAFGFVEGGGNFEKHILRVCPECAPSGLGSRSVLNRPATPAKRWGGKVPVLVPPEPPVASGSPVVRPFSEPGFGAARFNFAGKQRTGAGPPLFEPPPDPKVFFRGNYSHSQELPKQKLPKPPSEKRPSPPLTRSSRGGGSGFEFRRENFRG